MSPCLSTSLWCTVTLPREWESLAITRFNTFTHAHIRTPTLVVRAAFGVHVAPFQASIYSLLIALVKWVSLIVSDLTQFSDQFICGWHTQRF